MSSSSDPLAAALADLDSLEAAGLARSRQAAAAAAVEAARIEYLGLKQGRLKTAQERLKTLEPACGGTTGSGSTRSNRRSRRPARRPKPGSNGPRRRSPAGST